MARRPYSHPWFAALYDPLSRDMEARLLGPLRARLLGALHGRVLEIGVGTGASLSHYPRDARVIATEPDPHMLRRAHRRTAALGLDNVELVLADAEMLPVADATFDHAVSALVLCTVPAVPRALAEVRRVLRPGGRLHLIEHVRADGRLGAVQDVICPVWKRLAAGCNPNRRTASLIEMSGFRFEHLEIRRLRLGVPLIIGTAIPASGGEGIEERG